MNPIQSFLQLGGQLSTLEKDYSIKVKRHGKYPNLVQLKYDQINSPMGNPLVQECRGLVLDGARDWEVVAWPFKKFFNSEESLASPINWATASVLEKVDGSLIIMYYYDGKWRVATSGTPDASGQVNDLQMTFADLFWETVYTEGSKAHHWAHEDPDSISHDITFMWELTSPYNRIVVQHSKPKLTLIGMRNRVTGQEYDVRTCAPAGVPVVKHFDLTKIEDVLSAAAALDPMQQEGFVVVDGSFNRVKVKSLDYVAIHHMKGEGGLTAKRVLERIVAGESDEILAHFPEWTPVFTEVAGRYNALAAELEEAFCRISGRCVTIPSLRSEFRKEFAGYARETRLPSVMFSLLDKRVATVRDFLANMQIDSLFSVLKLDDIKIDDIKIDPQLIFGKVVQ